jgi:hypothetical protein
MICPSRGGRGHGASIQPRPIELLRTLALVELCGPGKKTLNLSGTALAVIAARCRAGFRVHTHGTATPSSTRPRFSEILSCRAAGGRLCRTTPVRPGREQVCCPRRVRRRPVPQGAPSRSRFPCKGAVKPLRHDARIRSGTVGTHQSFASPRRSRSPDRKVGRAAKPRLESGGPPRSRQSPVGVMDPRPAAPSGEKRKRSGFRRPERCAGDSPYRRRRERPVARAGTRVTVYYGF